MILAGDTVEILAQLKAKGIVVDHVITDPPYSAHVHTNARGNAGAPGIVARNFGYGHLTPRVRNALMSFAATNVRRWTICFSDVESAYLLRHAAVAAGLNYVRTRAWQRWSCPQFTGDRPSTDHESVVFLHAKGKKRWNGGGGGKETFLSERDEILALFSAVQRGEVSAEEATSRVLLTEKCLRKKEKNREGHPNEKPLELMQQIVNLVAERGETILDPFAGASTTGVAALRAGCYYIGIEQNPVWVAAGRARLGRECTST